MPFLPSQIEGRKRLEIKESGTYDLALAYEPKMSSGEFLTGRKNGSRHGQRIVRPTSEPLVMFLEKRLEDGKVKRLKVFEGRLVGSNFVGEIRFLKVTLAEGSYDFVVSRNLLGVERDRYGDIKVSDLVSDSQMSIRMKREGEDGFVLLN